MKLSNSICWAIEHPSRCLVSFNVLHAATGWEVVCFWTWLFWCKAMYLVVDVPFDSIFTELNHTSSFINTCLLIDKTSFCLPVHVTYPDALYRVWITVTHCERETRHLKNTSAFISCYSSCYIPSPPVVMIHMVLFGRYPSMLWWCKYILRSRIDPAAHLLQRGISNKWCILHCRAYTQQAQFQQNIITTQHAE